MAASGRKADVQIADFPSRILNGRFSRKRTFKSLENKQIEGLQTARSGSSPH
jgi:hypothetical protein